MKRAQSFNKRIAAGVVAAAMAAAGVTAVSAPPAQAVAAAAEAGFDYNGDGYADLAVSAWSEDFQDFNNSWIDAGAVTVLYGTPSGLGGLVPYTVIAGDTFSGIAAQFNTDTATLQSLNPGVNPGSLSVGQVVNGPNIEITQETPGVPDQAEDDDRFGEVLSSGDINGDGYDDLVISAFQEDIGLLMDAGSVTVMYGGPTGIGVAGIQAFDQDSPGVPGAGEDGDRWGLATVVADINNDGFADLFVGAPREGLGASRPNTGAVTMMFGTAQGLTTAGSKILLQGFGGLPGASEAEDGWGNFLAATDINGDSFDDIIVGAPFEDVGNIANAGAMTVIFGSANGPNGGQLVFQGRTAPGKSEANDKFGRVAAGDLNGDGFGDVVVSTPFENIGTVRDGGAVSILYGSANGLITSGRQLLWQAHLGTPGKNENDDKWGWELAVGDLNGDGIDDVAIGAPNEDVGVSDTGAVTVLYGSASGVSPTGGDLFHQNSANFPGTNQNGDIMGTALAMGDFDGSGIVDLAIGIPSDDLPTAPSSGAVVALPGTASGVTASGSVSITSDTPNVPGDSELGDRWGYL